jgi:hypothetical protein
MTNFLELTHTTALSIQLGNLEFRRGLLHRSGLVRRPYVAEPDGLAGELINIPTHRLRRFGLLGHAARIGRKVSTFDPGGKLGAIAVPSWTSRAPLWVGVIIAGGVWSACAVRSQTITYQCHLNDRTRAAMQSRLLTTETGKTILAESGAAILRIRQLAAAVTPDYRFNRVTVVVDEMDRILSLYCG